MIESQSKYCNHLENVTSKPVLMVDGRPTAASAGQISSRLPATFMKKSARFKTAVPHRGFALVVAVSMLVLLTMIALGLLSLSSTSVRSTSLTRAQERAQANARMALMIAIGELQMQMGPDQRISANSSILSTSEVTNSQWWGVWDSWRAGSGTYDRYPDA